MTHRYLSLSEAESKVVSGRSVECFLGACKRGEASGVRWLSVRLSPDKNFVQLRRYDTADLGTNEYVDVYEFGPLDRTLEADEADEMLQFDEFSDLWAAMERLYPSSTARLVNQGVIQDEYRHFKTGREA